MHCRVCEFENRPDAGYCGGCGQSLRLRCAACGNDNAAALRFCDGCGVALPGGASPPPLSAPRVYTPAHLAQKILTSRSALEGERKQVTVLFCDMANSTELARRLGADAMHELLNRFFELAVAEVHRLEGTINQFLGDGFMALFGAPVAHEDHVRRALLSALAIRHKLKEAAADEAAPLSQVRVRMGVNTGTVVVGRIGDNLRMDYTAVGDTTNIAARLQQLAAPGQICAGESVHAAGSPYFEFTLLGRQAVKGIAEPLAVYDLARARPREENASRARNLGIGSALVGRDRELALLRDELTALGSGTGGIVILAGEPGVGKSRLLAEARRLPGASDVLWLEGRAVSFGRSLSYWPFIEILKNCFAIADDDGEAQSWRKLEEGLAALFAERTPEMLPYLATMLALRVPAEHEDRLKYLDGQGLRHQMFLCMRQLFEQLALRRPVALVLEDWHWADQSSVELAEHLLPLAATTPLTAIFATRPDGEGPATRVRQFASRNPGQRFHEAALEPLSQEKSALLVANLVGAIDLPAALREQIQRKTEGNPLFIEEVIRSLVTDGVLVRNPRDPSWHLAKHIDEVHLPDTVQALLLARIDRLDDEAKHVLKLASVIGRSFFDRVLAAIAAAQHDLGSSVAELEHAELICQRQRLPELEYIFKHALVQEAAYGSILAESRRAIHRRVAQAIELLFEGRLDEFTSLLAHHYTHAEDWDKAQEYLFKAGDQAGRMAADTEALAHFRQAEAAYTKAFGDKLSPLQRATLARKIGAALHGTGHYQEALEQFRRALAQLGLHYPTTRGGVLREIVRRLGTHFMRRLGRRIGRPIERALDGASAREISTICHYMSWMDYFLDKERMVLDSLLELHAGEHSDYSLAEARGLSSLGYVFMTFNARRLARNYHAEAGAVAQRADHPSAIAFAAFTLGSLNFFEGRWDECISVLEKSAIAYREAGDIHGEAGALNILSFVVYFRGNLPLALTVNRELIRAGQDAAERQVETWGHQNLGYPMLACGPLDETIEGLEQGRRLAAAIPAWQNVVYILALLGKCHVLRGRLDAASALLAEAARIVKAEKLLLPFDQVELCTATAMLELAAAEQLDGAESAARMGTARLACRAGLRFARQLPGWLPEALRLQGTFHWLSGEQAAARASWRESVAVAQASGFPIERARTLLEMGHRTSTQGDVEQAAEIFRQSGARVFLASALHALAQMPARSPADADGSIARYVKAIAALEEVKADHALAQACRECARLQEQAGLHDDARPHIDRAAALFGAARESIAA